VGPSDSLGSPWPTLAIRPCYLSPFLSGDDRLRASGTRPAIQKRPRESHLRRRCERTGAWLDTGVMNARGVSRGKEDGRRPSALRVATRETALRPVQGWCVRVFVQTFR
jgi:hypothetical protein